jgi:hypothetical protein
MNLVRQPGSTVADRNTLLKPFASSIHVKATAFRQLDLGPSERARFLEAISDDIKKCTNFTIPEVSRAAFNRGTAMGIDLRTKTWHDQPQFDNRRRIFHLEHMVPVSTVRQLCLEAPSETVVLEILVATLRCVWILKEEDRELTRLGYRSQRSDPEAAYHHAKIDLIPR